MIFFSKDNLTNKQKWLSPLLSLAYFHSPPGMTHTLLTHTFSTKSNQLNLLAKYNLPRVYIKIPSLRKICMSVPFPAIWCWNRFAVQACLFRLIGNRHTWRCRKKSIWSTVIYTPFPCAKEGWRGRLACWMHWYEVCSKSPRTQQYKAVYVDQ